MISIHNLSSMPDFALRTFFARMDVKMFIHMKNSSLESKIGTRHTAYGM